MPARLLAFSLLGALSTATAARGQSYDESLGSARAALDRNDDAAALLHLDLALRAEPQGARALLLLGETYGRLGRHAEASSAYRDAVRRLGAESTPEGLAALCDLAASLAREERNVEAIETLRRVVAADPRRPAVHRDIGAIHLAVGRLEEAAAEFRSEIDLHSASPGPSGPPAPPHPALAAAFEGLGIASYRMGDDAAAIEALARAPGSVDATYHRGLALLRLGRGREASDAFREVLRRQPDHMGALQNLARAAAALGDDAQRLESLQRFQQIYMKEETRRALRNRVGEMRGRAERQLASEDAGGAVATLEEALAISPDDVDLLLDLGRACQRAADPERAKQALRRAAELDPTRAQAHFGLGRILADSGDLAAAAASLERATRSEPTSAPFRVALAQLYMRQHRSEEAVRELRLVARLNPADPDSVFNLGLGLAQAGSLPEAAAELERAVSLGYSEPVVHQVLATIYGRLGDAGRSAKEQALFESLSKARGTAP